MPTNVQKQRARPARSIAKPGDDHEIGLWIDYELLRKHQRPGSFQDTAVATDNRYLELADLALRKKTSKQKTKGTLVNGHLDKRKK